MVALILCPFGSSRRRPRAAKRDDKQKKVVTSNMVMMREKLVAASKALEGLSLEDFTKIAESAERMRIISRAASWHVIDSEDYARYSKNFQQEASDLKRHAEQKNLDAATLDYVRLTTNSVECHKHLREKRAKRRLHLRPAPYKQGGL